MPEAHFTAADQANLLAGQAVAVAEAYMDRRSDVLTLAREADRIRTELLAVQGGPDASDLVVVAKLLVLTMARTAIAQCEPDAARGERWCAVMISFVSLLRHESAKLAKGAQH